MGRKYKGWCFGDHKSWIDGSIKGAHPDILTALQIGLMRRNMIIPSTLYRVKMLKRRVGGPKAELLWCIDAAPILRAYSQTERPYFTAREDESTWRSKKRLQLLAIIRSIRGSND